MTASQAEIYRERLRKLAARIRGDLDALEEDIRSSSGAETAGNLSNAPMHLADLGTDEAMQDVDTTLYENEESIGADVASALERLDAGTFGACVRCGRAISKPRLDAIPYTPHCLPCAEEVQAGRPAGLDAGRPLGGLDPSDARRALEAVPEGVIPGDDPGAFAAELSDTTASAFADDAHAAGTPGGGTAVGGLAGTNLGSGDPANADLDAALGSGDFDRQLEAETADADPDADQPPAGARRRRR